MRTNQLVSLLAVGAFAAAPAFAQTNGNWNNQGNNNPGYNQSYGQSYNQNPYHMSKGAYNGNDQNSYNSGYNNGGYGATNYGQNGSNNAYGTSTGNYRQSENTQNLGQLSTSMIQRIQDRLGQLGLYHGNVDGTWGPETQSAVRDFQQQRGLQPSGLLNYQTLADLDIFGQNQSQYGGNIGNQNGQGFNNNTANYNPGANQNYNNPNNRNSGLNQAAITRIPTITMA
jgi:hypothetical protein